MCLQCPVGSYQPNIGSTQCKTCHASKVTGYPGATSPDQCIDAGMWLNVLIDRNIFLDNYVLLIKYNFHNGRPLFWFFNSIQI